MGKQIDLLGQCGETAETIYCPICTGNMRKFEECKHYTEDVIIYCRQLKEERDDLLMRIIQMYKNCSIQKSFEFERVFKEYL